MAIFSLCQNTWGCLIIQLHKIGTVYEATKFSPSSTSDQQLAVKISDKNSKACIYEKCSNKICLNEDGIT